MNKIFTEGRLKYGDKSFSTSIVKKLEEACSENLRASGFPSQLKDNQSNKKGIEINEFSFKGNREKIRLASVEKAIDLISSVI